MKRVCAVLLTLVLQAAIAPAARADHVPTNLVVPEGLPADAPVIAEGPIRYLGNVQAATSGIAAPLSEREPFARDGRRYLPVGASAYGLQVVDVTDPLDPVVVSSYSATFGCAGGAETWAARNFDFLALSQAYENDTSFTPDGRIAILGMDAGGRCHDSLMGGLELIDVTDVRNPRTLHLTRNVGEAHSVTIDPSRPWLAYVSSSDGADFIEIVDFKSCLGGVAAIEECRPIVARASFDRRTNPEIPPNGDSDLATSGCHDIRLDGDLLYCAAVGQTSIIDVSRILDGQGGLTGTHLTSGRWACPLRDAQRAPGVKVTDCSGWSEAAFAERTARSVDIEMLSLVDHDGGRPATQDIEISHQAEPTSDGNLMFITDERGGGLTNDAGCPGGGLWFYDIRDKRKPTLARRPDGSPAVYRTPTNLPGTAHMSCTIHYGEQVGDENLFVFAWYLNGVRALRIEPDYTTTPATITFEEVAAYLPAGALTIQAKPMLRDPNDPGTLIMYTADATRGMDIFALELPKISLREASTFPSGAMDATVRGARERRDLPRTGFADPATIALILVALAAFIARRLRAAW